MTCAEGRDDGWTGTSWAFTTEENEGTFHQMCCCISEPNISIFCHSLKVNLATYIVLCMN